MPALLPNEGEWKRCCVTYGKVTGKAGTGNDFAKPNRKVEQAFCDRLSIDRVKNNINITGQAR